jgi:hypothetical protein
MPIATAEIYAQMLDRANARGFANRAIKVPPVAARVVQACEDLLSDGQRMS